MSALLFLNELGAVYLASDTSVLGRTVALKILQVDRSACRGGPPLPPSAHVTVPSKAVEN
jgi:hypothetical protein